MLLPLRLNLEPQPSTPGLIIGGGIGGAAGYKKKETETEKRLRRESQGIIARAKVAYKDQESQLFDDAQDVVEQLKLEIGRLEVKAREFEVQFRHAEMIRAQLAREQLEAQIEEIDTAFVVFMLIAEID